MIYADIIVDISVDNLDKTYQFAVPKHLEEKAVVGALVKFPFGKANRIIKGYIISLSQTPKIDISYIKEISEVVDDALVMESHLIKLASWIREQYGATLNDALKVVLPVKQTVKMIEKRTICLQWSKEETENLLKEVQRKGYKARIRFLTVLLDKGQLDYEEAIHQYGITRPVIQAMEEQGVIRVEAKTLYRNPIKNKQEMQKPVTLTEKQQEIVNDFTKEYEEGKRRTYLLHGITGSGKTEVYMEMMDHVLKQGKQVILLIPEIALTYQTVMRFYKRFGDRISIMNSRLSKGERYDQYLRAKQGEIDIMIGPRSALFTPFEKLGLIIIDEEHEGSYKSEMPPKYHAREVAIYRASLLEASVILGSATPSLEAYKRAKDGEYKLYELKERVNQAALPKVYIVDLREELKKKNKSIFSEKLKELIQDRLDKKEQIMLFLNRRGFAGFVSCRSCGHVMKCPHCDVSLTYHTGRRADQLVCHYCGYEEPMPKKCPSCGSPYIATFGTGTQKVEEMVKKEFPSARVLRMDMDTTAGKDGHEKILSAFAKQEADILVGTQMIVKGHDFGNVSLVGILAADLSLYANDYRAAEKTFQLLTQAAGRAGRSKNNGEVVIQTYSPTNYSVTTAAVNDYVGFYEKEILFRTMMKYPPVSNILVAFLTSKNEQSVEQASELFKAAVLDYKQQECVRLEQAQENESISEDVIKEELEIIGPVKANVAKVNDIYRYVLYMKHMDYIYLRNLKNFMEGFIEYSKIFNGCSVQFDFNPMSSY
ncbi:replication restart helicase PriA [Anaerosporobacter faecicola]|uniref:replication restart helicase PriA n=1 Tax=Anaerosporobacter faecicola TaxID=2718714 RepID=UPI001EE629A0|nr:primosomal protein N' [Anaerosporobacter faecicola]